MPFLGVQPSKGLVGTAGIDADAVTSAKIADDQIDSEHYAAASIDTAHIATNQIDGTLTKDALIADYSDVTITAADLIMYGDATDSNNTKRDTVQGILDLAGGGGYAFVSQTTASTSATIAFEGLSGNYDYLFIIKALNGSEDANFAAQFATGSTTYVTADYQYQVARWVQDSTASSGNDGSGQSSIYFSQEAVGAGAGEIYDGYFEVFNMANSGVFTSIMGLVACETASAVEAMTLAAGRLESAAVNTAIKFYPTAGTFTDGSISMFRRANA